MIEEGKQKCSKCGRQLPLSEEYFARNCTRPNGFHTMCKECQKKYFKEYYKKNKDYYKNKNYKYFKTREDALKHIKDNEILGFTRKCSKCEEKLPATIEFFDVNMYLKCGLSSWCKECRRKSQRGKK